MAAILDGRTMKIICIRKNIRKKKNLLFLPSNMAAVQNLYTQQSDNDTITVTREDNKLGHVAQSMVSTHQC